MQQILRYKTFPPLPFPTAGNKIATITGNLGRCVRQIKVFGMLTFRAVCSHFACSKMRKGYWGVQCGKSSGGKYSCHHNKSTTGNKKCTGRKYSVC